MWALTLRANMLLLLIFGAVFLPGCAEPEPPEPRVGEVVFSKTCKACHASGLNGAPIFGNSKMWEKRVVQGVPTLIEHATNGFGLMPAKGGNTALTDAEVAAAVNYMVEQIN